MSKSSLYVYRFSNEFSALVCSKFEKFDGISRKFLHFSDSKR